MSNIKIPYNNSTNINNNENKKDLYPNFLTEIINKEIEKYIFSYSKIPEVLKNAIEYCVKNVGKRFRPILCLITANSLGLDYNKALPTACAIEYIHTYSLIHDDLPALDNDDYRRGKLTCHKVFGENIAILTGDALFAEAFNIIINYQKAPNDIILKILKEIAYASGVDGMVSGQVIDVYYTGKKITKNLLKQMHNNKTAKLICASVRCGAILANANTKQLELLTKYALNLGLAFQITDDLLDIESNSKTLGKTLGKDLRQKKNTFPSIYGISKSRQIAVQKIEDAIKIINSMDIEKKWLINIAKFLLCRKN